jgi:hypothetical protein
MIIGSSGNSSDEDLSINSEIIWTFNDVDKELLKAYPNGQALTEELVTIDGEHTWRVEFYPNGKDLKTYGYIILCVQLVNAKGANDDDVVSKHVDAECNFSFKNRKRRKHYVGKMNLKKFHLNQLEEDASFESGILKECAYGYPMVISIGITQYPNGYVFIPSQAYVKTSKNVSSRSLNEETVIVERGNGAICGDLPSTPTFTSKFNGSSFQLSNSKSVNNVNYEPQHHETTSYHQSESSLFNRGSLADLSLSSISSATPKYYSSTSSSYNDEDDFKKKTVTYLYGRV